MMHDATGDEPFKRLSETVLLMVGDTGSAAARAASTATPVMQEEFGQFVRRVRQQVEARLGPWLEARVAEAKRRGVDIGTVADAVRHLALRGGKRLRAVLLAAAYEACGGEGGAEAVAPVGVALELFQTYLLVHDDLMDGDDVRRGGPSLPASMRVLFARGPADAMSVLAGDLACAWAQRALLEVELAPRLVASAAREFALVHEQVVQGQILDVRGSASDATEVEAMHALKTASYSVRGPVVMGARLAGAHDEQLAALVAFAEPLGVAFQLCDDVLGTFGDTSVTGKPCGSDLREGKRTALVVEALRDASVAECLGRVLGRRDADEDDMREAIARIEACGARARIERRIVDLAAQSRAALARGRFTLEGRALLERSIDALTERRS
jgi:geranylgeranyl diphosphate synthase type I